MSRPATTPTTIYRPQVGAPVNDLVHPGASGIYMGTLGGRAYLRPSGGGVEWDTDPNKLEPVNPGAELTPVSQRSTRRSPECIRLPDGRA
ncbi:hypothetical protein [Kitasatospora kifunensis]|uniref:Uncharacterized protein n=1 Tax=Kitasatospora kifunensis TaxID=58351 RepID=A0A7W7VZ11_KITKI|nr:hypothetical protein [Kitasatospora kifunensis]MBB4928302.1 hypothetical protein [Kitasatospora kifunensis]